MGSIHETHLKYVQALRDRGEMLLRPKVGEPIGSVEGYIKTQIPHKDAGAIFEDKNGKFGLFNDFGALHVTGICWEDLGLCDARCWYEWMSPETYCESAVEDNLSDIRKSLDPEKFPVSLRNLVNTMSELVDILEMVNNNNNEELKKKLDRIEPGKEVL